MADDRQIPPKRNWHTKRKRRRSNFSPAKLVMPFVFVGGLCVVAYAASFVPQLLRTYAPELGSDQSDTNSATTNSAKGNASQESNSESKPQQPPPSGEFSVVGTWEIDWLATAAATLNPVDKAKIAAASTAGGRRELVFQPGGNLSLNTYSPDGELLALVVAWEKESEETFVSTILDDKSLAMRFTVISQNSIRQTSVKSGRVTVLKRKTH